MTQDEYRDAVCQVIEYIAVALGIHPVPTTLPDPSRLQDIYQAAKKHQVASLVASALKKCGIRSEDFVIAMANARRKSLLNDMEYKKIAARLEDAGVHYMPLKGMILKELYPETGMREMADIDILFEKQYAETVRRIMLKEGYECIDYGKTNHDVYTKASMFHMEMHRELFDDVYSPVISRYYSQKRFLSDGKPYLCKMSAEDLYLYLLAHLYQHYSTTGVGIRPLIDIDLYLNRYGDSMNLSYVTHELQKLELTDFEKSVRNLSQKLWSPQAMNAQEQKELDRYIFSSLYGSKKQFIRNKVNQAVGSPQGLSKLGYIKSRFKISDRKVSSSPFYAKHPRLVPLMKFTRPVKAVFTRPKAIWRELSELKRVQKK